MKKSALLIFLTVLLVGCNKNTGDMDGSTMILPPGTISDLRPSTQVFKTITDNWEVNVGKTTINEIKGTTKDGYDFSTDAYCADPLAGYTFVNGDREYYNAGITFMGEFAGTVTAISGTLKGFNETDYVWTTGEPVTDGFSQSISSVRVDMLNKSFKGTKFGYIPFATCLTPNGNDYDFTIKLPEQVTDLYYIYLEFSIYYVNEVTSLDSFTLSSINLIGVK